MVCKFHIIYVYRLFYRFCGVPWNRLRYIVPSSRCCLIAFGYTSAPLLRKGDAVFYVLLLSGVAVKHFFQSKVR